MSQHSFGAPSPRMVIRGLWVVSLCWTGGVTAAAVEVVRIDGSSEKCAFVEASSDTVVLDCPQRVEVAYDELGFLEFRAGGMATLGWPNSAGSEKACSGKREHGTRGEDTSRGQKKGTTFYLAAGGRICGEITGQGDETVVADTSVGDALEIGLSSLAGIWFGGGDLRDATRGLEREKGRKLFDEMMANRLPGKDVLLISRDGELNTIRGSVLSLGPGGGRFLFQRKEFTFKRKVLLGIAMATGVGSDERWPVLVGMIDGSEFACRIVRGDGSEFVFFTPFGGEISLPVEKLALMRFFSDRVVYLSALRPQRDTTVGLLDEAFSSPGRGDATWPARFDRSVSNSRLSIDGVTFAKGLGVHSRSVLEYGLDGLYETFAATIGIDDAVRPRGSVVFKIEGDGRVLFDSNKVTGRDAARNVAVDVRGVLKLSLMVDYGDGMDISDHADWGDARLIKPRGGG